MPTPENVTILGLGDSITATRHPTLDNVYYEHLATHLPANFPDTTWNIVNHGHGGWATYAGSLNGGFLPFNLTTEALDENATVVTIMLGTNDHSINNYATGNRTPVVSLENYKNNLKSIVSQIRGANNGSDFNGGVPIIILMTPPPVESTVNGSGTWTDNATLATYAQAVREVAQEDNTRLIDAYNDLWNLSGQNETTFVTTYTLDGSHLNQLGQDLLFDWVYSEILTVFGILNDGLTNIFVDYFGTPAKIPVYEDIPTYSIIKTNTIFGIVYIELCAVDDVMASPIKISTPYGVKAFKKG
jgi:lysophospholipase L1-like esterase